MSIFKIIASILHLGNVEIVSERDGESCHIAVSAARGYDIILEFIYSFKILVQKCHLYCISSFIDR